MTASATASLLASIVVGSDANPAFDETLNPSPNHEGIEIEHARERPS
jgi:hypothetical protein